jgi:hypothetical protein
MDDKVNIGHIIFDPVISDEARRFLDTTPLEIGVRFPRIQGIATLFYQRQREEAERNTLPQSERDAFNTSKQPLYHYYGAVNEASEVIYDYGWRAILGCWCKSTKGTHRSVAETRDAIKRLDELRTEVPRWYEFIENDIVYPSRDAEGFKEYERSGLRRVLEWDSPEKAARAAVALNLEFPPEDASRPCNLCEKLWGKH